MKKTVSLLLIISVLLTFAACGTSNGNDVTKNTTEASGAQKTDLGKIDVDLTALSSTVVYSEVYNMVNTPASYVGKVVKMKGAFNVLESEEMGRNYYTCIIKDATACCSQGLEFVLADESLKYPEDYPQMNDDISVVGIFDTYTEGEYVYCQLKNAEFV